jgi:hypothetical protein
LTALPRVAPITIGAPDVEDISHMDTIIEDKIQDTGTWEPTILIV